MKIRLTSLDIVCLVRDLQEKLLGCRIDQIYDVDKKTYLIRFMKPGAKILLLLESALRFHTTVFEWPKNPAPSGFTMKLRKHLSNKRLEKITQVSSDRIVDFQFGIDAVAYHLILECYDKGNMILTDHEYTILSVLRAHIGDEKIATYQKYEIDRPSHQSITTKEQVEELVSTHPNKTLREAFLNKTDFGPHLFSYVLSAEQLALNTKIKTESGDISSLADKIFRALENGLKILKDPGERGGFIFSTTSNSNPKTSGALPTTENGEVMKFYDQFHPKVLIESFDKESVTEFVTFDEAVDEFFSKIESQKLDMKQMSQGKAAFKKLESVKIGQQKKLEELKQAQEVDLVKAELVLVNKELVDNVLSVIRKMLANQIPWDEIWEQVKSAQEKGDFLASKINALDLKRNHFTMRLSDPYESDETKYSLVDIDIGVSAYANATKYFGQKKESARKEERTLESQEKVMKVSTKKLMKSLKEVATIHSIKKARKVFWFEKFRWFISSENYLIIGGRDAQQNEQVVKRYLKSTDVYIHTDAHGAPSIVIKNDKPGELITPKTLNEAATFAVCNSGCWDSKVLSSCWWVYGDQVSKSAPTGEYLSTGSFMIRGTKNYLPPVQLVLGFGFLFRLTPESLEKHKGERARQNPNEESLKDEPEEPEENLQEVHFEDDDDEGEEEEQSEFPDTHVGLQIDNTKTRVTTQSESLASDVSHPSTLTEANEDDNTIIVSSQSVRIKPQKVERDHKKKEKANKKGAVTGGKQKQSSSKEITIEQSVGFDDDDKVMQSSKPKRGQHGRNKKMKEKYKDQDDEERTQRMLLLGATKAAMELEKKTEKTEETSTTEDTKKEISPPPQVEKEKINRPYIKKQETINEDEEGGDNLAELDQLNQLTGMPFEDDEVLFAVPVIAPYSTLRNYKYRVKLTPGTAKRGKAAKNALEFFIRDKTATARERDVLKSVKDQDIARNFPGKVKLSLGHDK